jgi:hypothetical protein
MMSGQVVLERVVKLEAPVGGRHVLAGRDRALADLEQIITIEGESYRKREGGR